jgi:23S rRNA (cytidine1920-2'-O)/16S rRNA (cytidine1409-2'-O)-methyltransferase
MVKPQFEVGRENLGAGGVVRDAQLRKSAVFEVAQCAKQLGLGTVGVVASPLPGPSGNVEYFLRLRLESGSTSEIEIKALIEEAIEKGPQ